jgi:hypothetical protein
MSAPTKLRGGSDSELTRFKRLWPTLSESAREFWREQFVSELTRPQIRALLKSRLKVNLQWDRQLTEFRSWLSDQDLRDEQAARMTENESRIKDDHPDWTLEQVREEVLRQSYFETLASGNWKLGLATSRQDRGWFVAKTDREKFEFDAAKAALKHAAELKVISSNSKLSDTEKLNAARGKLFGVEGT